MKDGHRLESVLSERPIQGTRKAWVNGTYGTYETNGTDDGSRMAEEEGRGKGT